MPDKKRPSPYPAEFKERAVRMVLDHQGEYPTLWKAVQSISAKLDVNHETLRVWVLRAETDVGRRPWLTTDEWAKMKDSSGKTKSSAGLMKA